MVSTPRSLCDLGGKDFSVILCIAVWSAVSFFFPPTSYLPMLFTFLWPLLLCCFGPVPWDGLNVNLDLPQLEKCGTSSDS